MVLRRGHAKWARRRIAQPPHFELTPDGRRRYPWAGHVPAPAKAGEFATAADATYGLLNWAYLGGSRAAPGSGWAQSAARSEWQPSACRSRPAVSVADGAHPSRRGGAVSLPRRDRRGRFGC